MSEQVNFRYIGDYHSFDRGLLKHCFKTDKGGIFSLNFLISDEYYNRYLEMALKCCTFIPAELSTKEKVAFLQLTQATNEL